MKKVFQLALIVGICGCFFLTTGCATEYKPQGDYSQFDTVFENIEPPDRYICSSRKHDNAIYIYPSWQSVHQNGHYTMAITGTKLSSTHYYGKNTTSPVEDSCLEGYGFTLTRIRIEKILYEKDADPSQTMFHSGSLSEGDIITVKEYYAYERSATGEPRFTVTDCTHSWYLEDRRTVQKDQEYFFLLTGPQKGEDVIWETYIVEKMNEKIWALQTQEEVDKMIQEDRENYSNRYLDVFDILQLYRENQ